MELKVAFSRLFIDDRRFAKESAQRNNSIKEMFHTRGGEFLHNAIPDLRAFHSLDNNSRRQGAGRIGAMSPSCQFLYQSNNRIRRNQGVQFAFAVF